MPVKTSLKKNISNKNRAGAAVHHHTVGTPASASKKDSVVKNVVQHSEAPPDKCFWVNHGPVIKNLNELASALRIMSDEQFDYHSKRAGNDFAKWTGEVLGERACAAFLARAKTRAGAMKVLEKHVH